MKLAETFAAFGVHRSTADDEWQSVMRLDVTFRSLIGVRKG